MGPIFFLINFILFFSMQGLAKDIKKAEEAFRKGDYNSSTKEFLDAEIEEPSELKHAYNRSVSQFHQGEFAAAAQGFAKAAKSLDPKLSRDSMFNLGNSLVKKGELKEAETAYDQLLKKFPEDIPAKENRQFVRKLIEQQKQQQQQQQNNKDDKDNKDDNQQQQNKNENSEKQDQQQQKDSGDQENGQKQEEEQSQGQQGADKNKEEEEEKQGDAQEQENEKKDKEETKNQEEAGESGKEQEQKPNKAINEEHMSQEAAARLLRSLEDQEKYFGKPLKIKPNQKAPEKDW